MLTVIRCERSMCRARDVVAVLSAIELTASVGQARAALAAAIADRNNVYAGVRTEQTFRLRPRSRRRNRGWNTPTAACRTEYFGAQ